MVIGTTPYGCMRWNMYVSDCSVVGTGTRSVAAIE